MFKNTQTRDGFKTTRSLKTGATIKLLGILILGLSMFYLAPRVFAAPPWQAPPPNLLTEPDIQVQEEPDPDPTVHTCKLKETGPALQGFQA